MRILIVEDDSLLGDGLQVGLGQAGFTVDWLRDGQEAATVLASPEAHCFAAVVLDLNLPQLSGQEVLARCRAAGNPVPVLVLTARDGVPDKLSALTPDERTYIADGIRAFMRDDQIPQRSNYLSGIGNFFKTV